MKKRLLALCMVLALLVTFVPCGVTAEGMEGTEQESTPLTESQEETTESTVEETTESAVEEITESVAEETVSTEVIPEPHSHSDAHDCEHCDETVAWIAWGDDEAEKTTLPSTSGHYYLCADIACAARVSLAKQKIVICLNGYTVTANGTDGNKNDSLYSIGNGASAQLTISDCTAYTDAEGVYHAGVLTGGSNSCIMFQNKAPNAVFTMYDGIFTGNRRASAEGGAVAILNGGTFKMYGGQFVNNNAATSGAAVYIKAGVLEIIGESTENPIVFANNTAGGNGAILAHSTTATITNVKMTGNTAKDGGSAMHITNGAVVTLRDCTVTGNKISNQNKTEYRGALYVAGATAKYIFGGVMVVRDNDLAQLYVQNNNSRTDGSQWINVDGLEAGTEMPMTTYAAVDEDVLNSMILEGSPETWDKAWITYENNGLAVDYDKEKDEFFFTSASSHVHCACGEHLAADETCEHAANPGCDHSEITYEPWESTDSLPKDPGNYYLTGDVVVSKETPISTNGGIPDIINLCLNGYTITVDCEKEGKINDQIFYMSITADLTISDCTAHTDEAGNYVAGKLTGGTYGVITAGVTGTTVLRTPAITLNLYDGILTGNTANGNGGAVNLMDGESTFNMYGGQITGNTAGGNGGAVYVGKGNAFHMYGGEISGNTSSGNGGGVYIHGAAAAVSIEGDSVIAGNVSGTADSNLYLGGDITVTVGTMGENANVSISGDLGTLPRQVSANQAALTGLASDSQYRPLELIDGYVYISFVKDHIHCDCGGSDMGCDHTENAWVAWDNAASLPTGSGYYYLVTDVTLTTTANQTTGDLHLCLNGHTVTAQGQEGTKYDRIYTVSGDAKLTVSDCTAVYAKDGSYTAGKLTGGSSGVIFVPNNTGKNEDGSEIVNTVVINIYDGMITGNHTNGVGGALLLQDGATGNMYGGEISGNAAKLVTDADGKTSGGNAAAVYVGTNAVFHLHDGAISGNTAESIGAVYVDYAIFNMTGGKIADNKSAEACAGILVTGKTAVFTMKGGSISGNESAKAAGGVLLQNYATMKLIGGEIARNSATHGAGVYVSYTASFAMEGGTISGNTATTSGGGLYLLGSTANLTGGKISGNRATSGAGGIHTTHFVRKATETREEQRYTAEINLAGVTVSGNTSKSNGAGICASKATVINMTGGSVSGNVAAKAAGGMLLQSDSVLNLKGGTISNNSSTSGGGVYISTDSSINMTGGSVSNNTSTGSGGGMYLLRCNATLAGGSISGNSAKVNGGGVYMAGANAKLTGTIIQNNTAEKNGGGVGTTQGKDGDARFYTTITMTGGKIAGNTALNGGGVLLQAKTTMTLKDGVIENNKTTKSGAGMYISSTCTFHMEGGTVQNNEAQVNGGGIYHYKSDGTYTGGVIRNNKAAGNAGGLTATGQGNTITIKSLTVTGNQAEKGAGGVLFQGRVTGNIEGGEFTNNTAGTHGGAVYVSNNTFMTMTGGNFCDNTAGQRGGAVYLAVTSENTITNATFTGNKATDGGAIYAQSNLQISDCVISGNAAEKNGGGISTGKLGARMFLQPKGLVAKNLTVENNTAGAQGGGLYLSVGAQADIRNSTVTGNTSGAEGGGIWAIFDSSFCDLTVTGNTSGGEGYGFYLAASEYDGKSYVKGVIKFSGVMTVKDNQGGDMYIGEQTAAAIAKEGLAEGSLMNIKLHSGLLTQTLYGAYNYEGGNGEYVVTAGDLSLTNPEYDPNWNTQFNPTEPETEPTETPVADNEGVNPVVWVLAGAAVAAVAAIAVIIAAVSKKKKTAAGK